MNIQLGRELTVNELHFTDLIDEATASHEWCRTIECYNLITENGQGLIDSVGQMIYFPDINRAAICLGGDSQWTDATSIKDAIRRYNEDDMCE